MNCKIFIDLIAFFKILFLLFLLFIYLFIVILIKLDWIKLKTIIINLEHCDFINLLNKLTALLNNCWIQIEL